MAVAVALPERRTVVESTTLVIVVPEGRLAFTKGIPATRPSVEVRLAV